MVKDQGITEGYWQLIVNFGFKALNAPTQDQTGLAPALLGVVNHFGIQRVDEPTPGMTIDAATGEGVGSFEELMEAAARNAAEGAPASGRAPGRPRR